MLPRLRMVAVLLAAGATALGACAPARESESLVLDGGTMGTRFRVRIDDPGAVGRREELARTVRGVLDDVDARMSTWKADSEVSRINDARGGEAVQVSDATYEVLETAARIAAETDGAFDVTVGPLVDAWGFGPTGEVQRVPDEREISGLRDLVGHDRYSLDPEARTVTKSRDGVRLDLSAIAKGYAVDRVAAALRGAALEKLMVEVGGEVTTRGVRRDGRPWRIGIERPVAGAAGQLQRTVPLVDASIASSGNYRNFYVLDGRTVAHTIDPRTGRPVEHRVRGVSVVTARCAEADALATALMVMGPEQGLQWARARDLPVLFVIDRDGELAEVTTPAFERLAATELQ